MSYELLSNKLVKALKTYTCEWCGEKIVYKELHNKIAQVYEGDFQSIRFHKECNEACNKYFTENRFETEYTPYDFKRGSTELKYE